MTTYEYTCQRKSLITIRSSIKVPIYIYNCEFSATIDRYVITDIYIMIQYLGIPKMRYFVKQYNPSEIIWLNVKQCSDQRIY